MFLHHLTPPQREAFVALAHAFIALDQQMAPEEWTLLNLMRREMEMPPEETGGESPPSPGKERLQELFADRRSQVAVLLELIGLGYADGEFSVAEYGFVRDLAKQFGVSKGERLAMENWVVRQLELSREATEFWDLEE